MIVNRTVKARIDIIRFYKGLRRIEKYVYAIKSHYIDMTIRTINNEEGD